MAGLRLHHFKPRPHLRWIPVLICGSLLFAAVLAAVLGTQDILYVPSLPLVGAAVVPVTFLTFVGGLPRRGELSFARIAVAAALGGVIGIVVAGSLEFETVRSEGYLVVGGASFILLMATTWHLYRHDSPDRRPSRFAGWRRGGRSLPEPVSPVKDRESNSPPVVGQLRCVDGAGRT
jgi:hypothetical protein